MYRLLFLLIFAFAACQKNEQAGNISFIVQFDPNQARLDNFGQPAAMPAGHAAQTPEFHKMSVHYIELVSDAATQLGFGKIIYKGAETTAGGENAVDFEKAALAGNGGVMGAVSLDDIPPGTYKWVRASVTYQNYDVLYNLQNVPVIGALTQQKGAVASFVGFNTYIKTVTPYQQTLTVNGNKKQGFWAFETELSAPYQAYNTLSSGQAPAGATTVVNPLFLTSPIPAGSCVVTGELAEPLVITAGMKNDVKLLLSFSVNNSFEWEDPNGNGQWDIDVANTANSEKVVDMGLRGLIPRWE